MSALDEIHNGNLQKVFASAAAKIKKCSCFDVDTLPIDVADIFSYYLYLKKSLSDTDAFVKITEYLEWRERLSEMSPPSSLDHTLGCSVMTIYKHMPECQFGYDKYHRPVVYFLFGQQSIKDTLRIITRKQIFDYHLWQNDAINELCYHKSLESNNIITSCTLVLDVKGLNSDNASADFLHILNRRAEVNGRYFPYLYDKIVVLNAAPLDSKMIRTLKEFCDVFSPRANVYLTGPERNPSEVLINHIDLDQLPSEYGGLKGSLHAITHPFYDSITLRRVGGGVLPRRNGGVSYPSTNVSPDRREHRKFSTATNFSASPYEDAYDSSRAVSTVASTGYPDLPDESTRTYSSASSRIPNNTRIARSASVASSISVIGGSKADYVLSSVPMTPMAKTALGAFIELLSGGTQPYAPLLLDLAGLSIDGQTTISTTSMSPISNRSIDIQSSTHSAMSLSKVTRSVSNTAQPIAVSLTLKSSVFSIAVDGVQQTSVGRGMGPACDVLSIKTASSGVVVLKASPVVTNGGVYTHKRVVYKKYSGNLILSNGRIYCLTRGASMCGWLQKWPMRSQSAGSYTHRYFILEDNELKYWKAAPSSAESSSRRTRDNTSAAPNTQDPPKGSMVLTHNTTLRRSKTLFGSNTIEIKSELDSLTICAYNAVEDTAWYSELYHAIERVKKFHREACSNERPFPEVIWRQSDPSCVAVDADVIDATSSEEYFDFRYSNPDPQSKRSQISTIDEGGRGVDDTTAPPLQYAVLCRVHTGLSSLHSVQIGQTEHAPIRLENNDLDLGVKLMAIKVCGNCLVVSGSNGFVGAGKIPQLSDLSPNSSSTTPAMEPRRIYVRRLVNSYHSDDTIVGILVTPRSHGISSGSDLNDISSTLLASADDMGGVCVWRRDGLQTAGSGYSTPAKSTGRTSDSWSCLHHAKVGHRVTAMSFSPDGNTLAVTTPERAILFDVSPLLAIFSPSDVFNGATPNRAGSVGPLFSIRTAVIDDSVGINTPEVVFAVDLSRPGLVKVWKIAQGVDVSNNLTDDPQMRSESGCSATSDNRNMGYVADRVHFTEISLSLAMSRAESSQPLRRMFKLRNSSRPASTPVKEADKLLSNLNADSASPSFYRVDSYGNKVPTTTLCSESENGSSDIESSNSVEKEDSCNTLVVESGKEPLKSSVNEKCTPTKPMPIKSPDNGYYVDPFGYADVFVIDPLRMHLRDWWCDYSSRYLLLGHERIAALTNFESVSISSHTVSRANSSGNTRSSSSNIASGLDKKSTSMFWSTLTSSLGRRVICRYYIPLEYHERRNNNANTKRDCIHFLLFVSRCLFETLGDEYIAALMTAWKAKLLDETRDILEKWSPSWFRDISTTFLDILRRIELSPALAINCLEEITSTMLRLSSECEFDSVAMSSASQNKSGESGVVDLSSVLGMFNALKNAICLVSDDYGINHAVPAPMAKFISNGIQPMLADGKSKSENVLPGVSTDAWVHEDVDSMLHSLIIEPLSYLERTEPFAVALAVVGLQGVPGYIYKSIMGRDGVVQGSEGHSSGDRTSAEKLSASVKLKKEKIGKADSEAGIEGLISVMAREMPPWIRFILTSDSDKSI
mmetsp:Transcript_364/g.664  ORF Transcript_364/g.664 Transcript_364/m.664 type:complete len:1589 (-) Transcript_364:162-4928(-)|eukprot:CAMPEP_0185028662 /NCGR_PEP_ID=MMETSP1103-20130426/14549_1 /TAXON_ID=36769 /ORGANISM="Paraphysomonas bandaiensis, Strain Caron Lab Isolate" /LENGTH=1588 /DNA_ID=CAMNT_0027563149 /DNA_START=148 /DNA_END=4914 /DNA_ORIENTATION=-